MTNQEQNLPVKKKLFLITQTQYWYGGSRILEQEYVLAREYDAVENYALDKYGYTGEISDSRYYSSSEESEKVGIEELEVTRI